MNALFDAPLERPLRQPETPEQRKARLLRTYEECRKPGNWVEEVAETMTDTAAFEEAVRLGREWREEQNKFQDRA